MAGQAEVIDLCDSDDDDDVIAAPSITTNTTTTITAAAAAAHRKSTNEVVNTPKLIARRKDKDKDNNQNNNNRNARKHGGGGGGDDENAKSHSEDAIQIDDDDSPPRIRKKPPRKTSARAAAPTTTRLIPRKMAARKTSASFASIDNKNGKKKNHHHPNPNPQEVDLAGDKSTDEEEHGPASTSSRREEECAAEATTTRKPLSVRTEKIPVPKQRHDDDDLTTKETASAAAASVDPHHPEEEGKEAQGTDRRPLLLAAGHENSLPRPHQVLPKPTLLLQQQQRQGQRQIPKLSDFLQKEKASGGTTTTTTTTTPAAIVLVKDRRKDTDNQNNSKQYSEPDPQDDGESKDEPVVSVPDPLAVYIKKLQKMDDDDQPPPSVEEQQVVASKIPAQQQQQQQQREQVHGPIADFIDEQQKDHTPTTDDKNPVASSNNIDFWKCHCWKCQVELRHPDHEDADTMCCYALHAHPLLEIPVCCLCSEEVDAMLMIPSSSGGGQKGGQEEDTFCCSCGDPEDEVDMLFLCDEENCQRAICDTCVEQAFGEAVGIVERLSKNSNPWKCCCCNPPPPLKELQDHLKELKERPTNNKKTVDELLVELECVEKKKRGCLERLDSEDEMRREIVREVLMGSSSHPLTELNEQAKEEFGIWKSDQKRQNWRLDDMIASIRDELESLGFDLNKYHHDELVPSTTQTEDEMEREGKASADREVEARKSKKDALLLKLGVRENKKWRCEKSLEGAGEKRREIRQKLKDLLGLPDSSSHLKKMVKKEFSSWQSGQLSQKQRLDYEIDSLYDQFESHGINKEEYLRAKRSAKCQDDSEVEDLGSLSSNDNHRSTEELERRVEEGWVKELVSEEDLQEALAAENAASKRNDIVNVSDADDLKAMKVEDRGRSRARVRLDHLFLRQQLQTEAAQKRDRRLRKGEVRNYEGTPRTTNKSRADDDSTISSTDHSPAESSDHDIAPSVSKSMFANSSLVLSEQYQAEFYPIAVATSLVNKLKEHQRDGVEFMFRNTFSDLVHRKEEKAKQAKEDTIGGCILAHNMGLGK
jgi:hypothetical protein